MSEAYYDSDGEMCLEMDAEEHDAFYEHSIQDIIDFGKEHGMSESMLAYLDCAQSIMMELDVKIYVEGDKDETLG